MKSAVIFCFSGTGNTWWCALELARALVRRGIAARSVSIETIHSPEAARQLFESVDAIGLAYPIYGSDVPEPMKRFVAGTLPPASDLRGAWCRRQLFVFCTQLMFSGDGAWVLRRQLEAKGYTIRWSEDVRMPNNISVTVFPLPYTTEPGKLARARVRASRTIERLAEDICNARRHDRGNGPLSRTLGLIQRRPYRKWFPRLRNDVSIDHARCTGCHRCARLCPSGNLVVRNGQLTTRGTCVLCVRCYSFCANQAVLYMGRRHRTRRGVPYRGPFPDFRPEVLVAKAP